MVSLKVALMFSTVLSKEMHQMNWLLTACAVVSFFRIFNGTEGKCLTAMKNIPVTPATLFAPTRHATDMSDWEGVPRVICIKVARVAVLESNLYRKVKNLIMLNYGKSDCRKYYRKQSETFLSWCCRLPFNMLSLWCILSSNTAGGQIFVTFSEHVYVPIRKSPSFIWPTLCGRFTL